LSVSSWSYGIYFLPVDSISALKSSLVPFVNIVNIKKQVFLNYKEKRIFKRILIFLNFLNSKFDLSAVPMSSSAAIFFEQVSHQSLVVHLQANKTDFQKLFEKL
jgi:hypothetical protein